MAAGNVGALVRVVGLIRWLLRRRRALLLVLGLLERAVLRPGHRAGVVVLVGVGDEHHVRIGLAPLHLLPRRAPLGAAAPVVSPARKHQLQPQTQISKPLQYCAAVAAHNYATLHDNDKNSIPEQHTPMSRPEAN
jgi:hypothetical protein